MAWYINADQVADHISQRRLNLNTDNAAYYDRKNLSDYVYCPMCGAIMDLEE